QEREIERVGSNERIPLDLRIVAATKVDLADAARRGRFRDDLYYRLSVYRIELPPLRERAEDIPELAQHFLRQCQPDAASLTFHPDALTELQTREWRGNVRELRNVVERAAIVARGREIGPESLIAAEPSASGEASIDDQLRSVVRRWTQSELAGEDANDPLHERLLQIVEPELLSETLAAHSGNRAAAADRLGIHRATLRQKLRRYEDGESDQGK
ncbi:MAG: sigma-54-dependent Fis family transcriptional regulator, partial [Planctomycetaceae bacterium]|nr:sigma-54-dependent Fis family transcriptional regulator [Planctomycetaceae bacterium]